MARTNDYVLEVKTAKDLGSEAFARSLLSAWCNGIDPALAPECFGPGEPIRRRFQDEGVEGAVRLWLANKLPVMLRRKSRPRFVAGIKWRPEKGQDPRPYPWGCHVFLERSAGDELAVQLFRFLVGCFEPAFGSVSTEQDSRAKHWVTFEDRGGRSEQFMGLDVGRFVSIRIDYGREILPGVYWITYFGPGAKRIVGERRLELLDADKVERLGDGYVVRAYPHVSTAATERARQAEQEIMNQLGKEHFFDKNQLDVAALRTDEVTAGQVARKIEQIKAARK